MSKLYGMILNRYLWILSGSGCFCIGKVRKASSSGSIAKRSNRFPSFKGRDGFLTPAHCTSLWFNQQPTFKCEEDLNLQKQSLNFFKLLRCHPFDESERAWHAYNPTAAESLLSLVHGHATTPIEISSGEITCCARRRMTCTGPALKQICGFVWKTCSVAGIPCA